MITRAVPGGGSPGFEAQVAELTAAGCARIYKGQISSAVRHRQNWKPPSTTPAMAT